MVLTPVEERLAVESLYLTWLDRFDVSIQRYHDINMRKYLSLKVSDV